MTPDAVLDRAADLLERDGWHRGWLDDIYANTDSRGRRCAAKAMIAVSREDREARWQAADALKAEVGGEIHEWNDSVARDRRQVVRTLRGVARNLRAKTA